MTNPTPNDARRLILEADFASLVPRQRGSVLRQILLALGAMLGLQLR